MNGIVEAANKNIKKIVKKMVITYKDCNEMLLFALHGYRTSTHMSIGETPFSLVYGMETVFPVEIQNFLSKDNERSMSRRRWMDSD